MQCNLASGSVCVSLVMVGDRTNERPFHLRTQTTCRGSAPRSRSQLVNATCVPLHGSGSYTPPALGPDDSRRPLQLLQLHDCKGRCAADKKTKGSQVGENVWPADQAEARPHSLCAATIEPERASPDFLETSRPFAPNCRGVCRHSGSREAGCLGRLLHASLDRPCQPPLYDLSKAHETSGDGCRTGGNFVEVRTEQEVCRARRDTENAH